MDFAPIFDVLAENGYEGWVVVEAEQDPAKANPFEYAVKARQRIRGKDGAVNFAPMGTLAEDTASPFSSWQVLHGRRRVKDDRAGAGAALRAHRPL